MADQLLYDFVADRVILFGQKNLQKSGRYFEANVQEFGPGVALECLVSLLAAEVVQNHMLHELCDHSLPVLVTEIARVQIAQQKIESRVKPRVQINCLGCQFGKLVVFLLLWRKHGESERLLFFFHLTHEPGLVNLSHCQVETQVVRVLKGVL